MINMCGGQIVRINYFMTVLRLEWLKIGHILKNTHEKPNHLLFFNNFSAYFLY